MTRLMIKQPAHKEKMLAWLLLVYAVVLLIRERLRDQLYGESLLRRIPVEEGQELDASGHAGGPAGIRPILDLGSQRGRRMDRSA